MSDDMSKPNTLDKTNSAQLVDMSLFNHRIFSIPDGSYYIAELGSDKPVISFYVKKGKIHHD